MTKILKYTGVLAGFIAMLVFSACDDDISPVVEELDFDRVFTPLELEAKISNQTTVAFDWGFNKGIDSYVLEISDDSLMFANIIHSVSLSPEQTPYVYELPAGDSQYSVRIKGVSGEADDSKWATLAFKSLPENLFANYDVEMTGIGAITLHWKSGKEVSSVVFSSASGDVPYTVTDDEIAAGLKSFVDLPNAVYRIKLMNNDKVRGAIDYVLEGDVLLDEGADIPSAIAAASAGDVILLQAGVSYGFVGDYMIDKSIKIKGLDGKMPVLYTTDGDRMFYIGASMSPADSMVFENLYMSGFVNHDASQGQIRGVFDMEGEACHIGSVKFQGCKLYDMGRQIMRLRGGADQTVGAFVLDDCIIHNLGKSSGSYGVLCGTGTNTNVTHVQISNSTIDSLACHFIRYDKPTACESIIVENCTFNKAPYKSGRYFMDIRDAVISNGVEINNCILGNTSYGDEASIYGVRKSDDIVLSVNDSYVCTDFVNSSYSIVDMCNSLGMSSMDLWSDPDNGDFSFVTDIVAAGDPRWR
uniref:DUF5123 domain-containing protein n=1 Tax=Saccharicrinis fermentans DSM 9555 = JCM 21142 TaxID=869213 RepID=W7YH73_9BACT|nr:DUF5123 domain-containing protein [Saccharicrinis fermentans]GAF03766.1 hypothetical protein JCM21142_62447 [Saccharicrinis fermentans DSM 9555 = JCM 21142]